MKSLVFESWDHGRLRVNREFAPLLRAQGLTTFQDLMHREATEVAKNLRRERVTVRIVLETPEGERAFYLKRHGPGPWSEYAKSLIRFRWPILGAVNEWNAILRFHKVGIPTMTPVALGVYGRHSFLLTEAIDGSTKLSDWMQMHLQRGEPLPRPKTRGLIRQIARLARSMHDAGMHHQDFYAGHLLLRPDHSRIHVIDLGRVRSRWHLRRHWVVKDLAQLYYSARLFSATDQLRFLRDYLGRPLRPHDRELVRRVQLKSQAIARHTRKNQL